MRSLLVLSPSCVHATMATSSLASLSIEKLCNIAISVVHHYSTASPFIVLRTVSSLLNDSLRYCPPTEHPQLYTTKLRDHFKYDRILHMVPHLFCLIHQLKNNIMFIKMVVYTQFICICNTIYYSDNDCSGQTKHVFP